MAKGNWKPEVIHPKTRCRICGKVIKKNNVYRVYLRGVTPAHRTCAIITDIEYTEWFEPKVKNTEIEITNTVSLVSD